MRIWSLVVLVATAAAGAASAYPGGTPSFQTDAAPYCAGCHSSRDVEMLAGAPAAGVMPVGVRMSCMFFAVFSWVTTSTE